MSPDQLAALRAFFLAAEPQLPAVVTLMYDRFFEAMPETAALFKGDMREQHRQFASMLRVIIRITRSSELWPVDARAGQAPIPAVEKLGRLHAQAGVRPKHFEAMKIALCRCFWEMFPGEFSPDVEDALAFVFDVLSHASEGPKRPSLRGRMTEKALENRRDLEDARLRRGLSELQKRQPRPWRSRLP